MRGDAPVGDGEVVDVELQHVGAVIAMPWQKPRIASESGISS
ncbi:hypothetical protein TOK_1859 [Pseudonocardia sp. N23]|nr:hypothetical protein TOK_1859 [Pseudonocardia sp. N23]